MFSYEEKISGKQVIVGSLEQSVDHVQANWTGKGNCS
jgi:hypothetical protein